MVKKMNFHRYPKYPVVDLKDRTWPDKVIDKAPIWCSVDLRDGNQALENPMTLEQKLEMFQLLVDIGFKTIEIGFPSAAQVEFDFCRKLIDDKLIPDDVSIQVLTQSREHLILRTFEALEGVNNAIVHLYNSTSTSQRKIVFKKSKDEIKQIAIDGAKLVKKLGDKNGNDGIKYEYSPESFTGTEMDYAVEICNAVVDVFQPTIDKKLILNLPATVEMSTPNVHADQIEWFCRNINKRDSVLISLHAHNDRGSSVAASELGYMAGADRVEGTLFGNGERTGNLDLVTMALNMFSRGVDPELDFTDINKVRDIYMKTTGMDIHQRHPYVGELVYTAFSGSHQDAINKGMALQKDAKVDIWDVPYLPIDPKDVGRSYKSIVRINSQSGKGGVAYIMENKYGYKLPKVMHPEFGKAIQTITEAAKHEIGPEKILQTFQDTYLKEGDWKIISVDLNTKSVDNVELTNIDAVVSYKGKETQILSAGNGPIDAFVSGMRKEFNLNFSVSSYDEHAISLGSDSNAVAYIGLKVKDTVIFGVGIDSNISLASFKSVLSGLNRI